MSKYDFALLVPARFRRRLTGQTVLTERRMQELELEQEQEQELEQMQELELEVEKYISEKVSSLVETENSTAPNKYQLKRENCEDGENEGGHLGEKVGDCGRRRRA